MPGMAGGGLAALANQYRRGGGVRYYEEGGDTGTGGADSSAEGGAGAAFGGGNDPGPGSSDPGVGGGGGTDPGAAAQAAAQAVDNAVDFGQDVAAAEATLGAQIAAEADEAEAENAANTAAALGAQANAIAAEAIANAEEDSKNAEMAAVMSGQVAGFPGPSQATPGFGISFQNPFNTDISKGFGMFSPFATVQTPFGNVPVSPMDVAAPAMGRGASAVNTAVNVGSMMGLKEGGEISGRYQYTYNPENQTYTQISGPGMASGVSGASGMTNFGSGLGALVKGHNINENPTQEDLDKFLSALMNKYSQGGIAAAQQAQSKGRGQDTMLVHMTPGEVKGLQALAMSQGGSLTINPQTGLPEAGFLSAILPMVAGFALGPAGFQMMSALQAGLTVGALTGVATGSLKKGLMAGLGAYGGAGLGEGLQAAAGTPENLISANPPYNPDLLTTYGSPPTTPLGIGSEGASVSAGAYTPTPGMAPNVMPPDVASGRFVDEGIAKAGYTYDPAGKSLIKMTPDAMPPDVASGRFVDEGIAKAGYTYDPAGKSLIKTPVTGSVPGSGGQALGSVAKDTTYAQLPPPPPVQATGIDAITGGTKAMIQPGAEGAAARARFGAALPYGTTIAAGVPLASAAAEPPKGPEPSKSHIRGYDLDITNPSGTPQYTPQDTREREQVRYAFSPRPIYEAAQGGLAALNGQTYDDEYGRDEYEEGGSVKKRKSRSLKGDPYYAFADSRRNQSMEAAIEQNFAKGGLPPRFLSGGGDGMSDSIKARIGGVQEARLADGEFVVPADVVSHLGNGSSKAGAKKLYAMMDKIRKARTGRKSQAPEVNARKYMPA
jgi:hypothetical protein